MALETGIFISDLVAANPPGTDDVSQGDDHLRLIKSTLLNTFPNIDGVVNITDEELNNLIALAGSPAGTGLTNIVDDLTPQLGGNLDLNGFTLFGDVGVVYNADTGTGAFLQLAAPAGQEAEVRLRRNASSTDVGLLITSATEFKLTGSGAIVIQGSAAGDDITIQPQNSADVILGARAGGKVEVQGPDVTRLQVGQSVGSPTNQTARLDFTSDNTSRGTIIGTSDGLLIDSSVDVIIEGQKFPRVTGLAGQQLTVGSPTDQLVWGAPGGSPSLGGGFLTDIVDDITPQLGADLDINGNQIISLAGVNINLVPGNNAFVVIDGQSFPEAGSGTAGQQLTIGSPTTKLLWVDAGGSPDFQDLWLTIAADAGGPVSASTATDTLTFAGAGGIQTSITGDTVTIEMTGSPFAPGGLQNIVEDLSPQLGANLDVQTFDIISTGANPITLTASAGSTNVVIDALNLLVDNITNFSSDITIAAINNNVELNASGSGNVQLFSDVDILAQTFGAGDIILDTITTGSPAGDVILQNQKFPKATGSAGQQLTVGSPVGQLIWSSPGGSPAPPSDPVLVGSPGTHVKIYPTFKYVGSPGDSYTLVLGDEINTKVISSGATLVLPDIFPDGSIIDVWENQTTTVVVGSPTPILNFAAGAGSPNAVIAKGWITVAFDSGTAFIQ